MRSLGLDVGDRHIGVALSDPGGILATPLSIIERTEESRDIAAILEIVRRYQVQKIIVGLPLSLDGGIGEQAIKVQIFVDHLVQHTSVPVEYRDERLTTISARRLMQASRKRKIKQKSPDDSAAAAVILQSYLEEKAGEVDVQNQRGDTE